MKKLTVREIVLFAIFGSMMFVLKQIEVVPNFHPIALFIATMTLVYGAKALIPTYVFVFLEGLYAGFGIWWFPYLYIWVPVCLAVLILPRKMKKAKAVALVSLVCGLHGMLYGTLYAPYQCIVFFGGNLKLMFLWILSGLPYDAMHMVGNLILSFLAVPLASVICRLDKREPYISIT
ncbi:MAG: hypothetical protein J6Z80_06235 [Clostridia bacterium]|nr:hypothetical protein [Clostridia bacterium]